MPIFVCSKCHCLENTACCEFWCRDREKNPPLCSECDPEIGKWHGSFPKTPYDPKIHKVEWLPRELRATSPQRKKERYLEEYP